MPHRLIFLCSRFYQLSIGVIENAETGILWKKIPVYYLPEDGWKKFGYISLALCLLSLYSSVTINTERRRKEIAIRKINGAGIPDIIRLFANAYIGLLTGACILVFTVVYYWGNCWLEQYVERIKLNWIFFLCIYLCLFILVMFTIIFRILKVAKENPAEVIKSE